MPNFEPQWTGLTVDVVRAEDQGAYLFLLNLDGAQVVIGARKLGGIDSDLESARLAAQEQAAKSAQERPAPPAQPAQPEQEPPAPPAQPASPAPSEG